MKTRHLKLLSVALIASLFLTLTACHKPPRPPSGPYRPLTPYQKSLVSQLRSSGVQVVKWGEVLQIVLPTDRFFKPQTTQLRRHRVGTIERVASLVKSYIAPYRHPRISVLGYTDKVYSRSVRRGLSAQYARVIASYLWNNGVPQRWVHVVGHGASGAIASNRTSRAAAYNRRVVIRIN